MLSPRALLELAGSGTMPAAAGDWPRATGVNFHSGRLVAGDIFFALPGQAEHGITHAGKALEAGASFIISDRPHPRGLQVPDPRALLLELGRTARSRLSGNVIGVTGSAGKTTTKDLLAGLLAAAASPGNLNTTLALACTLVASAMHEPERNLILELGIDHRGEMTGLLDLTGPDMGILTSIAPSHLEQLGSVATVAAEKRRLLDGASRGYLSLQAADQLEELPRGSVTYGLDPRADNAASVTSNGRLLFRGHEWPLAQPGSAYATNLTGALSVALDLDLPVAVLQERLASVSLTPGRLQLRQVGARLLIDDSYNSNPASAASALEVLCSQPAPRAAILGDMRELGADSASYHRELGAATRGLELVIAVGEFAQDFKAGNPEAITAKNTQAALLLLDRLPTSGSVLVKASRSLGFERLVTALEEPS